MQLALEALEPVTKALLSIVIVVVDVVVVTVVSGGDLPADCSFNCRSPSFISWRLAKIALLTASTSLQVESENAEFEESGSDRVRM